VPERPASSEIELRHYIARAADARLGCRLDGRTAPTGGAAALLLCAAREQRACRAEPLQLVHKGVALAAVRPEAVDLDGGEGDAGRGEERDDHEIPRQLALQDLHLVGGLEGAAVVGALLHGHPLSTNAQFVAAEARPFGR